MLKEAEDEVGRKLKVQFPFTPKISRVILLTFCHAILMMLVWRSWYWIN